jgi:hypothetical protein
MVEFSFWLTCDEVLRFNLILTEIQTAELFVAWELSRQSDKLRAGWSGL